MAKDLGEFVSILAFLLACIMCPVLVGVGLVVYGLWVFFRHSAVGFGKLTLAFLGITILIVEGDIEDFHCMA